MSRSLFAGMRAPFRIRERNAQIEEEPGNFFDASVCDTMRRRMSSEEAPRAARTQTRSCEMVRI